MVNDGKLGLLSLIHNSGHNSNKVSCSNMDLDCKWICEEKEKVETQARNKQQHLPISPPPYPLLDPLLPFEVLTRDPQRKIRFYSVKERKTLMFLPPSPSDFILIKEHTDLSGEDGVISIMHDEYSTLYCYDFFKRRAFFVKTDANKDLYTFPFMYIAQFQYATHLYSVPIELLQKVLLGGDHQQQQQNKSTTEFVFNHQHTSLKSEQEILFLFSTGRCGSTLLCKMLDRIDGVLGLQSPEPFTSLGYLRNTGGATDEDIVTLLRIAVLAHCKPKLHHPGQVKKWLFKFRSQVSEWMDLFAIAFPKSENLFMYRNAEGVTKSIAKMMPSLEPELEPTEVYISLRSGLKWLPGDKKYWRDMASIYWLSTMDKASQFKKAGMQLPCVRYEELVAESENVVRELVKMFNIEMTEDNMPRVLDTMKEHSQEGVFTAHEHEGLDDVLVTMRRLVAENKDIRQVDCILPGTVLK